MERLRLALQREDGDDLAQKLQADDLAGSLVERARSCEELKEQFDATFDYSTPSDGNVALYSRLCAVLEGKAGRFHIAFEAQKRATEFVTKMMAKSTNWAIPILRVFVRDMIIFADKVDAFDKKAPRTRMEAVSVTLRDIYSEYAKDASDISVSKRWACMFLVNSYEKTLIKANIGGRSLPFPVDIDIQDYSAADRVTYWYFQGCSMLNTREFTSVGGRKVLFQVEENLYRAFVHCPSHHINRIKILWKLIPVRLNLMLGYQRSGMIPSLELWRAYPIPQLQEITEAAVKGNMSLFDKNMSMFKELYIRKKIFMVLMQIRPFLIRNIFKKAYLICGSKRNVSITVFYTAALISGISSDPAEVEMIIASQIEKKLIRAQIYFSQGTTFLTLPDNPFPK